MIAPRICYIAAGVVVHQQKVLLVQHKKLGLWLAPGGHVEANELPHQAALREVFEETGVSARIISAGPIPSGRNSEYQPLPFVINLHWISRDNYQARLASEHPEQLHASAIWSRGCEQHLVWLYRMELVGSATVHLNQAETTGIGWFGLDEVATLATTEDIKTELRLALAE